MENTINANKKLGVTGSIFLGNDETFAELMEVICTLPEAIHAAEEEAEEKAEETRTANLLKEYGNDYDLVIAKKNVPEKEKRRPGAMQLRESFATIAKKTIGEGYCEVFSNGYAVYDNGDRKTVLWVPDCGSTTYYFGKLKDNEKQYLHEKEEVGEDVLGACPWYMALMIAGENSIESNMDHPRSIGTTSDSIDDEFYVERSYRWTSGSHFDNPETAYLKKEAAEERRKALTEKQREVYEFYFEEGMREEDIAEKLGVSVQAVSKRVKQIKQRVKNNENFSLEG